MGGLGGTGGDPPHYPKNWLVPPPCPPHCFDPKMPILSFSCSFWPFCPNCLCPTSRPQLGNPVHSLLMMKLSPLIHIDSYLSITRYCTFSWCIVKELTFLKSY